MPTANAAGTASSTTGVVVEAWRRRREGNGGTGRVLDRVVSRCDEDGPFQERRGRPEGGVPNLGGGEPREPGRSRGYLTYGLGGPNKARGASVAMGKNGVAPEKTDERARVQIALNKGRRAQGKRQPRRTLIRGPGAAAASRVGRGVGPSGLMSQKFGRSSPLTQYCTLGRSTYFYSCNPRFRGVLVLVNNP